MILPWNKVSESPTRIDVDEVLGLDADDLFGGGAATPPELDEKLRQAYFWVVNQAIISPYYDIEFSHGSPATFPLGDAELELSLPTDQSYSSNALIPLLTFAVGGKCLLIGGPGRGKTSMARLIAVMSGSPITEVRRDVQQGQPQLTVSDLVGMALPKDLVNADSLAEIRVSWRAWLTKNVKIIDEYNRIPTRTQSALLTMVAEGYVESYDKVLSTRGENGLESWFFTANDDAGGGTFPVIQALKDRIDVTVAAAGFNHRFLGQLISRIEAGENPEENVPSELVFTDAEQGRLRAAIRAVHLPDPVVRKLEYFASHFEFVQHGARRFESRTKDNVATEGGDIAAIIGLNSGADLQVDPGAETLNSISVRALQSLILYSKAMAYFRGNAEVGLADIEAVVPFVLRGKLRQNAAHPNFDSVLGSELLTDPVGWLGELWRRSCADFDQALRGVTDPVGSLLAEFETGLTGLRLVEVSGRLTRVEAEIAHISTSQKLYGRDFDDLIALKYLHQRYSNYSRWLQRTRRAR